MKTCPECGRSFANTRGLGAHRRYAHGVTGISPTAERRRRRLAVQASPAAEAPRPPVEKSLEDVLLAQVFPAGLPAKTKAVQGAVAWLATARRLAQEGSSHVCREIPDGYLVMSGQTVRRDDFPGLYAAVGSLP